MPSLQRLHIRPVQLELALPFRISHGTRTRQPALLLGLQRGELIGWGEATATSYYAQDLNRMQQQAEQWRKSIERTPLNTPEQYWQELAPLLSTNTFLQAALDAAAYDLYTQECGLPLYRYLGLHLQRMPLSSYTIGMGTPEEMLEKVRAMPWPLYKLKLGGENDLDCIETLRHYTTAPLRVDINTGYNLSRAQRMLPAFAKNKIDFVEQPLPADQWSAQETLFRDSPLPLMADESVQTEADVERCAQCFHGINIKSVKCGGITPARTMIRLAREKKLRVMIGCMTESSVGISALAHLLPLLDEADLDGALLLKQDIAEGVRLVEGRAVFPGRPGTGVRLY